MAQIGTLFVFSANTIIVSARVNSNFIDIKTAYNVHDTATTSVHGITGTIVGTSEVQTLTNKTLTSPTITNPTVTGTVAGLASYTSPTITGAPTAAGATWVDAGTMTTVAVDGGTINGAVIGGSTPAAITGTTITGDAVVVGATEKIHLDGSTGGDTYISQGSANSIDFYAYGVNVFSVDNTTGAAAGTRMFIPAGAKFYLDGIGDTYITEAFGDIVDLYVGGDLFRFSVDAGLLLPDVDPPTANYGNRNSFVKAWLNCNSAGTIINSYNVSSVSRTGAGQYTVNWNTDFANANYVVVGNANDSVHFVSFNTFAVGSVKVVIFDPIAGVDQDSAFYLMAIGDQ